MRDLRGLISSAFFTGEGRWKRAALLAILLVVGAAGVWWIRGALQPWRFPSPIQDQRVLLGTWVRIQIPASEGFYWAPG